MRRCWRRAVCVSGRFELWPCSDGAFTVWEAARRGSVVGCPGARSNPPPVDCGPVAIGDACPLSGRSTRLQLSKSRRCDRRINPESGSEHAHYLCLVRGSCKSTKNHDVSASALLSDARLTLSRLPSHTMPPLPVFGPTVKPGHRAQGIGPVKAARSGPSSPRRVLFQENRFLALLKRKRTIRTGRTFSCFRCDLEGLKTARTPIDWLRDRPLP